MAHINQDTILWCDMDGVVAVYDTDGFRGTNPPFLIPDSHYFRDCTPDMRIIKALQLLHDVYHVNIKIISNIDVKLKREHHTDKYNWLKKYMPFINIDKNYYTTTVSKAKHVARITRHSLTKSDILISDYNNDLITWTESGGTSIKYANGINNPHSHKGIHIPLDYNSRQIANQLIDIIYNL